LDFLGIIIAARVHGKYGSVWNTVELEGQRMKVNYAVCMKQYWFQQIRDVVSNMWACPEDKQDDDWWMISWNVTKFNENRKNK